MHAVRSRRPRPVPLPPRAWARVYGASAISNEYTAFLPAWARVSVEYAPFPCACEAEKSESSGKRLPSARDRLILKRDRQSPGIARPRAIRAHTSPPFAALKIRRARRILSAACAAAKHSRRLFKRHCSISSISTSVHTGRPSRIICAVARRLPARQVIWRSLPSTSG